MRQVKYIMIEGCLPILFCDGLTHKDVASIRQARPEHITGAGFYDMPSGQVYGESTSLGMKPGAHDQAIIRKFLGHVE